MRFLYFKEIVLVYFKVFLILFNSLDTWHHLLGTPNT